MNPADLPRSPQIGLPPEQFAAAFPFHFAVNRNLTLVQVGSTLRRICSDVQPGAELDRLFRAIGPGGRLTLEWILENKTQFIRLEHRASKVQLRGEFAVLTGEQTLVFLGSPWFTDPSEIAARGLTLRDFAIHDPVMELLQACQGSKSALADAERLAARLTAQRDELRAVNERLRQQEAEASKLALIAARTDNGVALTDAAGLAVWVNEGFTRLSGYTLEEARGKKPGAVLQGPGTDAETVRYMGERLRRGEGFSVEIFNYHKDGHGYWVAVEVQPIRDDQGRVTNFMGIQRDITKARAARQELAIQFEVSRVLAEAGSLTTAIPQLLRIICENLDWQVGALWRLQGERLRSAEVWHSPAVHVPDFIDATRTMEFTRGSGFPGRIWAEGQPTWIPDMTREPNSPRDAIAAREGLRGAFGFPLLAGCDLWGVAEFFSRRIEEPGPALLRTFKAVCNQIEQWVVRLRAEKALRETNTLQQAILESANYAIISTTLGGTLRTFNVAAERLLGYANEEIEGKATPVIFHDPQEIASRTAELSRELGRTLEPGFEVLVAKVAPGQPDEREWTYVRKDGTRLPVQVSVTALCDESGGITGYLGIVSDLTRRKRDEAKVRQLNRSLLARSKCNQALIHAQEELEFMNRICHILVEVAGYKMAWVGYPMLDAERTVQAVALGGEDFRYLGQAKFSWADTELGQGPTGTSLRTRRPVVCRDIATDPTMEPWRASAIANGYASSVHLPLLLHDELLGTLAVYAGVPDAFDAQEIALLMEMANDLAFGINTLRTRAGQARAEESVKRRLRYERALIGTSLVLRQADTMASGFDKVLQLLLDVSQMDRAFISMNKVDPVRGLCMSQIHERVRPGIRPLIDNLMFQDLPYSAASPSGKALERLMKHEALRGPVNHLPEAERALLESKEILDTLILPIYAGTQFWGFLGFDDCSTVRRIDDDDAALLQNAADIIGWHIAAAAANQAKSDFLAAVSHELRTPLTSIRGFLQTLLADLEMPVDARQEFLTIVHDQSQRLSRLVNDLLDLTGLESGRTQFNDEPLDLRQIAQNCLLEIQPLVAEKNLRLDTGLAASVPPFFGDALRLQSVFTNLLSNAVKYTPAGGVVRLALDEHQGGIRIAVADTGPGIPADQQKVIFEKFRRIYRPGASATGTGLGLPIVQTIVEHYHGRIDLESAEGRGSCFRVWLPVAAPK